MMTNVEEPQPFESQRDGLIMEGDQSICKNPDSIQHSQRGLGLLCWLSTENRQSVPWGAFYLSTKNEQVVPNISICWRIGPAVRVLWNILISVIVLSLETGKEGVLKGMHGWETDTKSYSWKFAKSVGPYGGIWLKIKVSSD